MAEQVDAALYNVEATPTDPVVNPSGAQPSAEQLRPRDYPVLAGGDLRENCVTVPPQLALAQLTFHVNVNPATAAGALAVT